MSFIRKLLKLFNRRERWQLALLSVALIVRAFVELVGVASIAPFMAVIADPGEIQRNTWLRAINERFQFDNPESFLFMMGVVVIGLIVFSNAFSAFTQWGLLRFSWNSNHRLSVRLLDGYLHQPYSFFTQTNTAKLSNAILAEVQQVINGILIPALTILSRFLVVACLVGLLLYTDPFVACIIVAILGGAYGGLYLLVRARQQQLGQRRVQANRERFRVTSEAFGGIKDVKVLGRERAFLDRFKPVSWDFSKATSSNSIVAQLPRYLFEAIAFGGMILIVLVYLRNGQSISTILPTISLFAFAGYRLMPELQQMFAAISAIRFNNAALENLLEDMDTFPAPRRLQPAKTDCSFHDSIVFSNVSFRYPNAKEFALRNLSLTIHANQTIGIVGRSGAGKTTFVDLVLGLYVPEEGEVLIDNVRLTADRLPGWRYMIGYVPQHIFLCDDTITNNIAFGVPPSEIDQQQVIEAARLAHLDEFVSTLSEGYATIVGEKGVRLSGGQRQRIGIARALYHKPQLLVMDEATSALDGATESAVMDAINELSGQKTILLIAHRMTTVEQCDSIYMFEQGSLIATGTFDELLQNTADFREMANLSERN